MIQRINFMGKVHYVGSTEELSKNKPNERKKLQKYADKNDCDLVVLDRDYYSDGTGIYKTLEVKQCKTTGKNKGRKLIFDCKDNVGKFETKNFIFLNYN